MWGGSGKWYGRKCGGTCLTLIARPLHACMARAPWLEVPKIEEINLWSVLMLQNCSSGGVEIMSRGSSFLDLIKKDQWNGITMKHWNQQGGKEAGPTLSLQYVKANLMPLPQDTEEPSVSVFRERALFVPTKLRANSNSMSTELPLSLPEKIYTMYRTLFPSPFMWDWSTYATFTVCQVGKGRSVKYWSKGFFNPLKAVSALVLCQQLCHPPHTAVWSNSWRVALRWHC